MDATGRLAKRFWPLGPFGVGFVRLNDDPGVRKKNEESLRTVASEVLGCKPDHFGPRDAGRHICRGLGGLHTP
jgi:hypothetical protein